MNGSGYHGNSAFPPTRVSVIEQAGSADHELRERALQTLAQGYWSPVYKYLRLQWNRPREEAEDLTQGFFVSLIERDLLARYDPQRGRFRTYLRTCLDGFASNASVAASRQKRGGQLQHLSLDFEGAELELDEDPLATPDQPDDFFHREWVRALFGKAVDQLEAACRGTGHELRYELFRAYDLEGPAADTRLTYADLAYQHGIDPTKVTNELHAVRQQFRELVLTELRALTASDAEFREEARALLGAELA